MLGFNHKGVSRVREGEEVKRQEEGFHGRRRDFLRKEDTEGWFFLEKIANN